MANTSAIRQQAAHAIYQLSSPSCTRAIQKSLALNEKIFEFSLNQANGQDKTERARRLGRKTRQEIGKGNQITTL